MIYSRNPFDGAAIEKTAVVPGDARDFPLPKYSAFGLLAELCRTAPLVHPDRTLKDKVACLKYVVRGLAAPRLSAAWLAFLNSPLLSPLVRHPHPLIFCKLQRPYLHRRLGARGRLAVLARHYQFLKDQVPQCARLKILRPEGCVLARLSVPESGDFTLRLSHAYRFGKEGDLNLEIIDESCAGPICTLTFTVTAFDAEGAGEFFIGGLQGHKSDVNNELVVKLTRSLHGLRPKALLLFALQRLAQLWGISRIRGVSDAEHIYGRQLRRRRVHACYDDFWRESQGRPSPDGNFDLPAHPTCRTLDEIPKNKRSLYRRRYEMLARLGEEIRSNLVAATPAAGEPVQTFVPPPPVAVPLPVVAPAPVDAASVRP